MNWMQTGRLDSANANVVKIVIIGGHFNRKAVGSIC
jgi:hypothetical protein